MRTVTSITLGVPSTDLARAQRWYRTVLGPVDESTPAPGVAEFELQAGIWLQILGPEGAEPPGPVLRIGVADLDTERRDLLARDIAVEPIVDFPLADGAGRIHLAYLEDPDGNRLCLYQIVG